MTFKSIYLILYLIFGNVLMFHDFSGFGQESNRLDSLLRELEKPREDTSRVNSMALVARMLYRSDASRAKPYAAKALALSEALSYTKGLAETSRIMGNIHQAEVLDSALYYYLESLKHYEALGDSLGRIDAYYNIANVYLQLSNFEAAKKNQLLCCELAEKVNNHAYSFRAKNGMGIYYIGLGLHYEENKDSLTAIASYQEGIPFLLEALQHADSIDSEYYKSQAYGNLAYVKTALGDFDTALTYALRMLKTYETYGYEAYYPISYTQIADIYLKMGNYQQAISYANSALEWINESDGLYGMKEAYEILYKAHKAIGDYEAAIRFGQRMFDLSRKIFNKEREEQIARIQAKFDTEQIEKENELLKKEAEIAESSMKKQRVYVVLALSLLVLIIAITILIYRNLLNKKCFAKKVQDLQIAKTRWFTNIAHELRTPLTLILGPVRQMISCQIPADSMRAELEMVQQNSEHLVSRVNEILDISRMESGELVINRRPEDLTVLVREIIDSFQSLARQKSIFLKFSYNTSLMISIDRSKVSTIFNNLLSNALKFTPSGGTVSIDWDFDPDSHAFVDIKVRDTGIGIPKQDLPHIFDRFYQVSHSQQPQSGGSGVGLSLAQELARLHGGFISVSSLENHGSVFELSLPKSLIIKTDSYSSFQSYIIEQENDPTLKPEKNMTSGKPSILLVEDHPDMRQYIGKLLGDHYHVVEAIDGQQAMEIIKEYTPDLIISDVMMPVMGGLTFAKNLKEDPKYKLTPFIALTAHANERDKLMAYRTGIDDYMVKPFTAEELIVRIQNLLTNTLERKKATQELSVTTEKEDKQILPLTHEEKLIEELEKMVREHLSEGCSISSLATHAAMSESSLNRFLKKITGLTPGQFIRDIRLQEAIFLLESQQYKTISEVVYAVGFEDASSFTRLFKKRFGKCPTTYLESMGEVKHRGELG